MLLCVASPAQAVLFRVGPLDVPSPPGHGFPLWYQDTKGLVFDLCLPKNQAQLDAGVCLILPPAQDPAAGLNLPLVFPTNFPDEAFYWNAGTQIGTTLDGVKRPVLALEAAFANGGPAINDQISFGRIRIIVDAPVDGTYKVTHPYGVETFPTCWRANGPSPSPPISASAPQGTSLARCKAASGPSWWPPLPRVGRPSSW
jgi:hypothetical protein